MLIKNLPAIRLTLSLVFYRSIYCILVLYMYIHILILAVMINQACRRLDTSLCYFIISSLYKVHILYLKCIFLCGFIFLINLERRITGGSLFSFFSVLLVPICLTFFSFVWELTRKKYAFRICAAYKPVLFNIYLVILHKENLHQCFSIITRKTTCETFLYLTLFKYELYNFFC